MRTRTLQAMVLLCMLMSGTPRALPACKPLLGRTVYWAEDVQRFDTLGWRRCAAAILDTTLAPPAIGLDSVVDTAALGSRWGDSPRSTLALFASRQRRTYETREICAVALALVVRLGYPVVVLSQWNSIPSEYIRVHGSRQLDDTYGRQRLATDFLYEQVERADIQPASRLDPSLAVSVWFAEAGMGRWPASDDMCKQTSAMTMPEGDYVLDFIGGTSKPLTFVRRIYRAFVVTPADITPAALTTAVEREMDRLKLDMSYRAPVFKELKQSGASQERRSGDR